MIKRHQKQVKILGSKCCANSIMILYFLENALLGSNGIISPQQAWMKTYPVYIAVYSHAIEEFGKALYLDSLDPVNQIVEINEIVFKRHKKKISLAKDYLEKHHSKDELIQFKDIVLDQKFEVDFDLRLNIFQTDINKGNNEDNIKLHLISKNEFRTKTLKLKQIVWDFKQNL